MEATEIKDVLEELGYQLTPDKDFSFRTSPKYRPSDNPTSLKIYSNGNWQDFSAGLKGTFPELIKLSLGLKTIEESEKWLKDKNFRLEINKNPIPKLTTVKVYPKEMLENLFPEHDYWIKRGISLETLKLFKGGLCKTKSRFLGYYVFPVYGLNISGLEIVGFAGRDTTNTKKSKWRLTGNRNLSWKYPLFLNHKIIKEKNEVILIESIGNCLKLWDSGIKNTIVLFGLEMNLPILNFLLKFNIQKIIIALDNDINNNNVGNEAAQKLFNRLNKYFNQSQLIISHPNKKDFCEQNIEENKNWYSLVGKT